MRSGRSTASRSTSPASRRARSSGSDPAPLSPTPPEKVRLVGIAGPAGVCSLRSQERGVRGVPVGGADDRDLPAANTGVGGYVPVADEAAGIEQVEEMLRFDARTALSRALEMLERLTECQDSVTYQRWLLIKGAAQARLGDTEDGARIMREVRVWADARGEQALLALSHRRLSALFRRVGDPALMLEHA